MELGGRYEVGEVLGKGAFATVYRVRDKQLHVDRAAKIMPPARDDKERDLTRRLLREAKALQSLDHEAIVKVFDSGEQDGATWVVMEVVEGGTVADRVGLQGVFTPEQAVAVAGAVLDALHVAHLQGIIHRDVKPSNVLLTPDGRPKLVDFGIARILDNETSHKTRTGMAMGSLAFMAPEQKADATSVAPAADVYGVATTVFFMLTGESPLDLFTAGLDHDRWGSMPRKLREVLWKATRYEAGQRYASAAEMSTALLVRDVAARPALGLPGTGGGRGVRARAEPPPPPPTRRFSDLGRSPRVDRRPLWFGLAGVLFIASVGAGTWWLATHQRSTAPASPPIVLQPEPEELRSVEAILSEPEPEVGGPLDHRWEGRCGDHWVRVQVVGSGHDVSGTSTFAGVRREVDGRYDEAARSLVLHEQDCAPCGSFAGRVSPDLATMTGSYDSKGGLDCTFSGKLK